MVNILSQNTTSLQISLDKLTIEITDNNDRSNNTMKETNDLKLVIETYQNITDNKLEDTENSTDKIKETFKGEIEKMKNDNDDTNKKLRILEDRSIPDNLLFDGIEERKEESCSDTEQNLEDTLSEVLGIQNRKIERAHRVGDKKRSPCITIVAKLSNCKKKECILKKAKSTQRYSNLSIFFESHGANTEKELGKGK